MSPARIADHYCLPLVVSLQQKEQPTGVSAEVKICSYDKTAAYLPQLVSYFNDRPIVDVCCGGNHCLAVVCKCSMFASSLCCPWTMLPLLGRLLVQRFRTSLVAVLCIPGATADLVN